MLLSASQLRRLLDGAALSEHATRCGHVIDALPRASVKFFVSKIGVGLAQLR